MWFSLILDGGNRYGKNYFNTKSPKLFLLVWKGRKMSIHNWSIFRPVNNCKKINCYLCSKKLPTSSCFTLFRLVRMEYRGFDPFWWFTCWTGKLIQEPVCPCLSFDCYRLPRTLLCVCCQLLEVRNNVVFLSYHFLEVAFAWGTILSVWGWFIFPSAKVPFDGPEILVLMPMNLWWAVELWKYRCKGLMKANLFYFSGRWGDCWQVLCHLLDPGLLQEVQEEEGIQGSHRQCGPPRGQNSNPAGWSENPAWEGPRAAAGDIWQPRWDDSCWRARGRSWWRWVGPVYQEGRDALLWQHDVLHETAQKAQPQPAQRQLCPTHQGISVRSTRWHWCSSTGNERPGRWVSPAFVHPANDHGPLF